MQIPASLTVLFMTQTLPAWRRHSLEWLRRQTASPVRALKRFTGGGFVFAFGAMLILLAQRFISPGVAQEVAALVGLCILMVGAAYALSGYLALSLLRILRYLLEPVNDRSH